MTPEERAADIRNQLALPSAFVDLFAAQIREAIEKTTWELKLECKSFHANNDDIAFIVRAEALEDAAKVAEQAEDRYSPFAYPRAIAKDIRALKDGVK